MINRQRPRLVSVNPVDPNRAILEIVRNPGKPQQGLPCGHKQNQRSNEDQASRHIARRETQSSSPFSLQVTITALHMHQHKIKHHIITTFHDSEFPKPILDSIRSEVQLGFVLPKRTCCNSGKRT